MQHFRFEIHALRIVSPLTAYNPNTIHFAKKVYADLLPSLAK